MCLCGEGERSLVDMDRGLIRLLLGADFVVPALDLLRFNADPFGYGRNRRLLVEPSPRRGGARQQRYRRGNGSVPCIIGRQGAVAGFLGLCKQR